MEYSEFHVNGSTYFEDNLAAYGGEDGITFIYTSTYIRT